MLSAKFPRFLLFWSIFHWLDWVHSVDLPSSSRIIIPVHLHSAFEPIQIDFHLLLHFPTISMFFLLFKFYFFAEIFYYFICLKRIHNYLLMNLYNECLQTLGRYFQELIHASADCLLLLTVWVSCLLRDWVPLLLQPGHFGHYVMKLNSIGFSSPLRTTLSRLKDLTEDWKRRHVLFPLGSTATKRGESKGLTHWFCCWELTPGIQALRLIISFPCVMIRGWKFCSSMGPTNSRIGGEKDMDSFLLQGPSCLSVSGGWAPHWRPPMLSWWGLACRLFPLGKELKSSSPLNPANTALAQKLERCLVPLGEMKGLLFLFTWHHSRGGIRALSAPVKQRETHDSQWKASSWLQSVKMHVCAGVSFYWYSAGVGRALPWMFSVGWLPCSWFFS